MDKSAIRKIIFTSIIMLSVVLFFGISVADARDPVQMDSSCAKSCMNGLTSVFEPLYMRNYWQKSNDVLGGEGMQMVWDIDWNPNDVNVLYLVTDTTKVWKSADGGDTWEPTGTNDVAPKGGSSIVSDPTNENIVLLSSSKMYSTVHSGTLEGFYLSMDGGDSWSQVGGNHNFSRTKHGKTFLFDELSYAGGRSMKIFAGSMEGIFKSVDGGLTWSLANAMNGEEVYDLEWADEQHTSIMVCTNTRLYLLNSIANTIVNVGAGLPGIPYDAVVSHENHSTVFVVSTNGVYKSADGGLNFAISSSGLDTGVSYRHIAMSRVNESRIFVSPNGLGGNNPYYTANGGASWVRAKDVNDEQFLDGGYYYPEPIALSPANQLIAITQKDSALAKTSDGGASWEYSGNGFTGARLNGIAFINENSMIFCLTDYGLYRSDDGGQSFYDLNETGTGSDRSCGGVAFNGNRIIATYGSWYNQDIITSDDNGATWTTRLAADTGFSYVTFNPDNKDIAYADSYYSLNSGQTWKTVGDGYKITAIDPKNHSIIYGWKDSGSSVAIGKSVNNGVSWTQVGGNINIGDVKSMDVDPFSSNLHIIVTQSAVYQYFEGGSWSSTGTTGLLASSNENYQIVRFDPFINGIVWAGLQGYKYHGRGLFLSLDGGQTWSNELKNLGAYNDIYNIEISPYDSKVYATGPGVWSTSIKDLCGQCFASAPVNNPPTQATPLLTASDKPYNTTHATLNCYNQSTKDIDGDIVTNSYKWYRNSTLIPALKTNKVNAQNTTTGDIWKCEITPYDNKKYGTPKNSSTLKINTLPAITSVKLNSSTANNYSTNNLTCYASATGAITSMTAYYIIYNGSKIYSTGSKSIARNTISTITTVKSTALAANQVWKCSVRASYNGIINESTWNNASITIKTAPPVNNPPTQATPLLTASDAPINSTDATLNCYNQSTKDIDGDIVTNSYKWYRNSTLIPALKTNKVNAQNTTTGDIWKCEITPYDNKKYGTPKNSSTLTIRALPSNSSSGLQGAWDLSTNYLDQIKGNKALAYGNTIFVSDPTYGSVLKLNSTNSYLKIAYVNSSLTPKDGFTVDIKVKFDSLKQSYLVYDTESYILQIVYLNATATRLQAGVFSGNAWYPILSSVTNLQTKKWYRVTYTYDKKSGIFKLYLDKRLNIQKTWSGKVDILPSSQILIGNRYELNRWLNGSIHDLRIYNKALSDAEVSNLA